MNSLYGIRGVERLPFSVGVVLSATANGGQDNEYVFITGKRPQRKVLDALNDEIVDADSTDWALEVIGRHLLREARACHERESAIVKRLLNYKYVQEAFIADEGLVLEPLTRNEWLERLSLVMRPQNIDDRLAAYCRIMMDDLRVDYRREWPKPLSDAFLEYSDLQRRDWGMWFAEWGFTDEMLMETL